MNDWINVSALWRILVFGLIAGAGLPALFALGMLSLSKRGSAAGMAGGATCFLIVLAAIGWGIYQIYTLGHPH